MTTAPDKRSAGTVFWRFSLAFYALPGVAEALLALQDREGRDVNLILFGLWLGLAGRGRLDEGRLVAAEGAITDLRDQIVVPLRRLRRRLAAARQSDMRRLRAAIGRLELAAEQAVQRRLAACAGPVDPAADAAGRCAAAHANLLLCLGPIAAAGAETALLRRALAGFAASAHDPPSPGSGAISPQRRTVPVSRSKRSRARPRV